MIQLICDYTKMSLFQVVYKIVPRVIGTGTTDSRQITNLRPYDPGKIYFIKFTLIHQWNTNCFTILNSIATNKPIVTRWR